MLLIWAEGTKTPRKCYRISFVRGRIQGCHSMSCGSTGQGRPHRRQKRRGGSPIPRRKAKCLEHKSTAKNSTEPIIYALFLYFSTGMDAHFGVLCLIFATVTVISSSIKPDRERITSSIIKSATS